jgi:hypothetical protein
VSSRTAKTVPDTGEFDEYDFMLSDDISDDDLVAFDAAQVPGYRPNIPLPLPKALSPVKPRLPVKLNTKCVTTSLVHCLLTSIWQTPSPAKSRMDAIYNNWIAHLNI